MFCKKTPMFFKVVYFAIIEFGVKVTLFLLSNKFLSSNKYRDLILADTHHDVLTNDRIEVDEMVLSAFTLIYLFMY